MKRVKKGGASPREGCRDQRPIQGAIPQSKLKETGGPNPIFNFQFLGVQGGSAPINNKGKWWAKIFYKPKKTILQPRIGEKSAESGSERTAENGRSL